MGNPIAGLPVPPYFGDYPTAAANVPESVPSPATFNETNTITSTTEMLANTLQVDSGPSGQPAVNAAVSITNLPPGSLQTYRWE